MRAGDKARVEAEVKQWMAERGFDDARVVVVPEANWHRCGPSDADAPMLEGNVVKHRNLVCELGRRQPTRWTAEGVAGMVDSPVLFVSIGGDE